MYSDAVRLLMSEEKIEYYGVLSYADCRESAPNIMARESFTPRSVIIYLLPYYTGETVNISRYAASLDYHIAIKEINEKIGARLKEEFPNASLRGYGDHSPIDERAAALSLGLGRCGKNGLLLNEKYGSYVFIGDIVTDIPPDTLGASKPEAPLPCIGCGICLDSCPTGILRTWEGECLSAITQKKGELSEKSEALMRKYNTAWGCDECQRYCPYNKNPRKTPIEFFYRDRIECLTEDILSSMSDEEFSKRAFAWRRRATVERNLAILANKKEK